MRISILWTLKKSCKRMYIRFKKIVYLTYISQVQRQPNPAIDPLAPLPQSSRPEDITANELVLARAEEICHHVFDLLGSGKVNLGRHISWNKDFKTGHAWPQKFYLDMLPIDPLTDPEKVRLGYDGKVPYELSRFHHGVTLAQAFCITGNEKYADEFVFQLTDWIAKNPVGCGVNWTCSMDVAIRAANWILACNLIGGVCSERTFAATLARSLWLHGHHISKNLERSWRGQGNNHYLSDLVGLLYIGLVFRGHPRGLRWLCTACRLLTREMQKQVYPDGFDFEASTCYHRLVLELFFYSAWLCKRNGIELPQAFWDRLYKMFEVVLYVLKPNGRLPQLGDNDSGRLHILYPREVLDGTYLLSYAAILFEDCSFKVPQFGLAPEAAWVFGREGVEKWQALPPRAEPPGSKAFPNAGVYVMRHNDDYMLISCGPNGQNGLGGHAHNDKLSFELCIGGEEVIVDPGTYVYTSYPEWRNRFRSTAYHNTIVVDGQEQNPIDEEELFRLPDLTRCRCLVWETGPERDVFIGEHYGYLRLDPPVVHRRKVEFYKKERVWVITDYLYQPEDFSLESARGWWALGRSTGRAARPPQAHAGPTGQAREAQVLAEPPHYGRVAATHRIELDLHLAPGVEVLLAGNNFSLGSAQTRPAGAATLTFYLLRADRTLGRVAAWGWENVDTASGWYSPEYGRKEEAGVVRLKVQAHCPRECRLVLTL